MERHSQSAWLSRSIFSSMLVIIYYCFCLSLLLIHPTKAYSPPVKRVSLNVSEINVTFAGQSKPMTVFNGTYPGPELRFSPGDIVLINVTNAIPDDNTTVHWHGLSQRMTPYADGTPLSQWPIAPGKWFEYEIHPQESDIGTRFYHSHVKLQSLNANGPLIIQDPKPPFRYQHDRTLLVMDYWFKDEKTSLNGLLNDTFVWIGTPDATMVNGKGLTADLKGEPYILDVDYDQTYYLRYIGAQGLMYYQISLLNHTMQLVEVDGTYVKAVPLSSIELAAGQRIGTTLASKTKEQVQSDRQDGCYWMRFESQFRSPQHVGWMVVRYPGGCSQLKVPVSNNTAPLLPPSKLPWISDRLEPLSSNKDKTPPDDDAVTRRIVLWTQQVLAMHSDTRVIWPINGLIYNETLDSSDEPYMIRIYHNDTNRPSYQRAMSIDPVEFTDGEVNYQRSWDPISHTWTAKGGDILDIVIINNNSAVSNRSEIHPWHFHSSKFWHMASGAGDFTIEKYKEIRASGAFKHPILKDTVTVYPAAVPSPANQSAGSWVILRYQAVSTEAGVWPLHCHIAPHLVQGMATNIAVDPDEISRQLDLYDDADPNYFVYGQNVRSPYTMAQLRGRTESGAQKRRRLTWLTAVVGAGGAAIVLLEIAMIMLLSRVEVAT